MTWRKQIAAVAFQRLCSLWVRKRNISEGLRLRLYNSFIVPVLTYNMDTWGLTPTQWARCQLRQVIGIGYPEKISSNALYERCECGPMSLSAIKARWCLFGLVMRMAYDTPAQMAIYEYIAPTSTAGSHGRPRTTLPTNLDDDLQGAGKRLRSKQDLQHLRIFAADRNQWRDLSQDERHEQIDSLIVRQQRESVTDDDDDTFILLLRLLYKGAASLCRCVCLCVRLYPIF